MSCPGVSAGSCRAVPERVPCGCFCCPFISSRGLLGVGDAGLDAMSTGLPFPGPGRRAEVQDVGSKQRPRGLQVAAGENRPLQHLHPGHLGSRLLPGGFSHTRFSVCPHPEMIYRHMAVMDGEMVHFEILDTAGQVSWRRPVAVRPWETPPGTWDSLSKAVPALPPAPRCRIQSAGRDWFISDKGSFGAFLSL